MVPLQLMSISGKELHVSVLPLHVPERPFLGGRHPDGLRGLSRGLRRGRGLRGRLCRLGRWTRRLRSLGEAARAREPVLGRPLRPALFWAASACFWSRAAGLFASGLRRGAPASWARDPEPRAQPEASQAPEQAPGQALEQGPDLPPHCPPFLNEDINSHNPGKSQRKRWFRGYLPHFRRCR